MTSRDSRSQAVAKQIRADIIAGELTAGARLTEALLAKRYEVSRIPVRESLRALAAEGLVELRPYAGATVAAVPDDDAADLFSIRIELESATARRAAQWVRSQTISGEPAEGWWTVRRRASEILTAGDEALACGELVLLAGLNKQFHQAIAELSDSATLMALLEQISGRIEWLYAKNVTHRGGEAWAEHHEIIAAIDSGYDVEAAMLMRQHVQRSKDSYFTHRNARIGARE